MCEECGCTVKVERSITEHNDTIAHGTWHLLCNRKILCVNIMGAPGSGKTTLIEQLAGRLEHDALAVIQGDLESDIDRQRLTQAGISAEQINTHSGCHLDAGMVRVALGKLDLSGKKYLFVENVGNLVCPAGVKIGQHLNIVVSSSAEGSDKPRKYPHIFRDASVVVLSKMDLADAAGFDQASYTRDLSMIAPKAMVVMAGKGMPKGYRELADFLKKERGCLHERGH